MLLLICLVAGCRTTAGPNAVTRRGYFGPTESMAAVINQINSNNAKLPMLWASHDYEATIVGNDRKSHFVNGDGVLLYRSPTDLRLVGSKDILGTVFEIGTTDADYWVKVVPEVDTLWIGRYADLTDAAAAAHQIPMQPDMILQVLGIIPLDSNLNELPAPTMRFNNDADAYMLIWNTKLPDRWVAQREVWYDREHKWPLFVFLFDANGRVVLRAALSRHRQVEVPGVPQRDWPWIAGDFRLFFPENGSKIQFALKDVQLRRGEGRRAVPNDQSFRHPDPARPGVGHVITIR